MSQVAVPIDFEALFASSPNAYVLLDRALTIVWANDAYLAVTMRERDDIVGRGMFDAFPSDPDTESYRLLESSLQRAVASGTRDEIALIRYDIETPDGAMDQRYWSATHVPMPGPDGRTAYVLQHTVDVTELEGLRALRDEMGIVERAHAVQTRNDNLSAESEQLRALFEQAPGFVALLDGPRHEFRLANAAYLNLVGQREMIGKSVAEALPEVVGQGFVALLDEVRATGLPYIGRAERVALENEGAGTSQDRFLDFIYQPIFAEDGAVTGVLVQGHEVTHQVEAQEQQTLLINELNHRVKNTLAVVQGLASQSFRELEGSADARRTFDERLTALAAAHSILTAQNWKEAPLAETIEGAIAATAGSDVSRVELTGPELVLTPQAAVSAAMLIHELSTNARKYGALANDEGRVRVTWTLDGEAGERGNQRLTIVWRETGGPPVSPPERRGFGTRLIQRGIATGLRTSVELDYMREGLCCTIVADLPGEQA